MTAFAAVLCENSKLDLKLEGSNADEAVQAVLGWLSVPRNRQWLLVFDNVDRDWHAKTNDQQAYDVSKYFPRGDHGSILITSQLNSLNRHGKSLQVGRVDDGQARCILGNELDRPISGGSPDVDSTIKKLDGLPLALTLAGSLIREMHWSFSTYNEHYDKQWTELMMEQDEYPLQEYPERGLLTTWNMSYNQIRGENEDAACLLRLWSMLSNEDLWYELFSAAEGRKFEGLKPEWLLRISVDKLAFSKIMRLILRYSLADRKEPEETYSMHSVLHEWMFHTTKAEEEEEAIRNCWTGCALVAEASLLDTQTNSWPQPRRFLPHASQVCRRIDGLLSNKSEYTYRREMFESSSILGHLIHSVGKFEEAERMYIRALQGAEKALGCEHPSTLGTVHNLGALYHCQGKFDKAEELYTRAQKVQEKEFGCEAPSTLETVNNFGVLYHHQGKLDKAEELFTRALNGQEKELGWEHPSTLDTASNLGVLYHCQGKLDEAEKLFTRALHGFEEALGREHPSTHTVVNNLCRLYDDQGKVDEAEKLLTWARKGYEKVFGAEHRKISKAIRKFGYCRETSATSGRAQTDN